MTQQKSQKRRVRERMSRTGERYTTARAQVVRHDDTRPASPEPTPPLDLDLQPTSAPAAPAPAAPAPAAPAPKEEQILARTGRAWAEWRAILDAWGGADRPHPEIARWLAEAHGVDGWWAQELTVTYERAIGRRQVGQHADGFSITVTRTVGVPVHRLFDAIVDDAERAAWLDGETLRVRTATAPRTARFDWNGGPERVVVGCTAKSELRSVVALAHERIPDRATADARKATWVAALDRLKAGLEA